MNIKLKLYKFQYIKIYINIYKYFKIPKKYKNGKMFISQS